MFRVDSYYLTMVIVISLDLTAPPDTCGISLVRHLIWWLPSKRLTSFEDDRIAFVLGGVDQRVQRRNQALQFG